MERNLARVLLELSRNCDVHPARLPCLSLMVDFQLGVGADATAVWLRGVVSGFARHVNGWIASERDSRRFVRNCTRLLYRGNKSGKGTEYGIFVALCC